MSDPKKLFEETRKGLSSYQRALHYPTGPKGDADHVDNQVHAVFYSTFRKTTWYFHHPAKLDCIISGSEQNSVTFRARSTPHHGLLYTSLIAQLPSITAKDGYEVRWCPNVGINIFETASMSFNDDQIQNLDHIYCDNYVQTRIPATDLGTVNIGLGNIPTLQDWSSRLPSHSTSFIIPWFYTIDPTAFFPLYMCGAMDRVEHNLTLRRKISQLLMVRKITGSDQEPIMVPFSSEYVTVGNGPQVMEPEIPIPEMFGEYLYLTEMESNYYRCQLPRDSINIDSVHCLDSENPSTLNTTVVVSIPEMRYPVHTIHWVAENTTALSYNYRSNYTTMINGSQGHSPIEWTTLETSKGAIFRNLASLHTERIHPSIHFRAAPHLPGYNAWTFGMRAHELGPKPAINMSLGKISVRLKSPSSSIDGMDIDSNRVSSPETFVVKVRLVYTHKLKFKSYPSNDEERSSRNAVVEIVSNDS
jgi:hypothetical protein